MYNRKKKFQNLDYFNNKKISRQKSRNNSIKTSITKYSSNTKLFNQSELNYYNFYEENSNAQNNNYCSYTKIIKNPIPNVKYSCINYNKNNFQYSKNDNRIYKDDDIHFDISKTIHVDKKISENISLNKTLYKIYKYKKILNSLKARNDYFKGRIKYLQNENLKLKNMENKNPKKKLINQISLLLNKYEFDDVNNDILNLEDLENSSSFNIIKKVFLINKEYKIKSVKNNLIKKISEKYSKTDYSKLNDSNNNNFKNIYIWIKKLLKAYDKNDYNNLMSQQNKNYELFIQNLFDLLK